MILALGSLGLVAALNWHPLTLLLDTLLHWPNISMGLSQVALIACAAGSCVMITTVSSARKHATIRRIAIAQYAVAGVIAVVSMAAFVAAGQQPAMSPEEYLKHNLASGGTQWSWLLPLLYVLLALSAGVVGRPPPLQPQPSRLRAVRLHHRHRADGARQRLFLHPGGGQHPPRGGRRGCHAARLRHAGGRRRVTAAQHRRLVRLPPRAADASAAAHRARAAPARRRDRGTPAWAVGIPGGRTDVADLRRIVPGSQRRRRRKTTTGRYHRRAYRLAASTTAGTCPTSSRHRYRWRNRLGESRSGYTPGAGKGRKTPTPRSRDWDGCASRARIRTANGSSRSRSNTECWTARGSLRCRSAGGRGLRRMPHSGRRRANRPAAPCGAAHQPSGRRPAGPLVTARRCAPQYAAHPRRACSPATSVPCRASRSTRRR